MQSDIGAADIARFLRDVPPFSYGRFAFALAEAGVRAGQPSRTEEGRPLVWTLSRAELERVRSELNKYSDAWEERLRRSDHWLRLEVLGHIEEDLEPLILLLQSSGADGVFVHSQRDVEPVPLRWPPRIGAGRGAASFLSGTPELSGAGRYDVLYVSRRDIELDGLSALQASVLIVFEEEEHWRYEPLSRSHRFWKQVSAPAVAIITLHEHSNVAPDMSWRLIDGMERGIPLDVILSALTGDRYRRSIQSCVLDSKPEFLDSLRRDSKLPIAMASWFSFEERVFRARVDSGRAVAQSLSRFGQRVRGFEFRRHTRPPIPGMPAARSPSWSEPPGAIVTFLERLGDLSEQVVEAGGAAWNSVREGGKSTARRIRKAIWGPVPRFLQANVLTLSGEPCRADHVLEPATAYRVTAFIGPVEPGTLLSSQALPEEELPFSQSGHELTIVFIPHQGSSDPQIAPVLLPIAGRSNTVEFRFRTPQAPGPIDARLIVMFENRILQTARLVGYVDSPYTTLPSDWELRLLSEAVLRADFEDVEVEPSFDAALVINHDAREQPAVTGVRNGKVVRFGIEGLAEAIMAMDARLETLAACDSLSEPEAAQSLRALARHAAVLYQELKTHRIQVPQEGARLQVLAAHAGARFPLELVYDRTPPLETATLCANAPTALAEGKCPASCQKGEDVVCPLGFWGIRYTIERHVRDPQRLAKPGVSEWTVQTARARRPKWLSFPRNVVLGYSKVVDTKRARGVTSSLSAKLRPSNAVDGPNWTVWCEQVKREKPGLLVLVAHAALDADGIPFLEIGGERRGLVNLDERFVGKAEPRPIVLLLACEQGRNAIPFQSAAARFNQLQVAATIAPSVTIYAPRALEVVGALVEAMVRAAESEKCLGDALAELRRGHLWSNPMVLSLVSYGDADVRLCLPTQKKKARGR